MNEFIGGIPERPKSQYLEGNFSYLSGLPDPPGEGTADGPAVSSPAAVGATTAEPAAAEAESVLYRIPVFLSYATPYNSLQTLFLSGAVARIRRNLLFPRTLGRSDQNTEPPLTAIRRMILSSYGLIAFAFRRTHVESAVARPGSPDEETFENFWLTSPYLQIEPSMAYQFGMPVAIFVENGVSMNSVFGGILELGAAPISIITFNLNDPADIPAFFNSAAWRETFLNWTGQVRSFYSSKTEPRDC